MFVDAETAARTVRPYSWFLGHVGAEGIKLTTVGYPSSRRGGRGCRTGPGRQVVRQNSRQVQIPPVLDLRESAMRLGLLRKYGGMLIARPRGRKLRDHSVGLWWHLAEQLPPTKIVRYVTHAGLLPSSPVRRPKMTRSSTWPGCAARSAGQIATTRR